MNSDLIARWTTVVTNIAVIVGLIFVGLEFRNTARAIEAERIDDFIGGNAEINSLTVESESLSQLLFKAHTAPDSLTGIELDRVQSWLLMNYDSFRRQTLAYQAGLLPDSVYEVQKAGIGFVFISDAGLELIDLFRASGLDDTTWRAVDESAREARKYCLDPSKKCMARYEALRAGGG